MSHPASTDAAASAQLPGGARAQVFILSASALVLAVSVVAFASIGEGTTVIDGALAVMTSVLSAAPAVVYVLAAVGLGRLGTRLYSGAREPLALQAAIGVAVMLTLSHAMGWAGAFGSAAGRAVALAPLAVGLVLLGLQITRAARATAQARTRAAIDPLFILLAPGAAVLLVAACQPPGWLWATEFGAYDALEYHLQLPQEWLAAGRLAPSDHNVYSYLPSYVEAAFLHVGAAMGAPRAPVPGTIGFGLTAHDGAGGIACQVLHALLTVLAAGLTGCLARSIVAGAGGERERGLDDRAQGLAFCAAAGLVLLTPWSIVVGSLAYNEMAVLALLAGALLVSFDTGVTPVRRSVLAALLVGTACGAKPTALTFAGIPVAIVLLGNLPARVWLRVVVIGAAVGVLTLLPWMVRNWAACGNPAFPFATKLFGVGRWTVEQVERYGGAHRFDGSLAERLRLLIAEEPLKAGERGTGLARHRGAMHPQYFALFPLVLVAAGSCVRWVRGAVGAHPLLRPSVLLVLGLLAQAGAWLFTTHLQSRFLLPLVVPGAALIAVQLGGLGARGPGSMIGVARVCAALALLAQACASAFIFVLEHGGAPNRVLVAGPGYFSGELFAREMRDADAGDRAAMLENAPVSAAINLALSGAAPSIEAKPGAVYFLGDATPFYYSVPVVYNTTYDRSLLGEAMRRAPGDPGAWTRELRALGVRFVLYAPSEIRRLQRSGWYDPLVTTGTVEEWLARDAALVREWPGAGRALFELREPAAGELPR